jgi:hypothetical protein
MRRPLKIARRPGHPYCIPRTYRHNDEFIANHQERPEIYDDICAELRRMKNQFGLKHVGIAFIWERLRYLYVIEKRRGDDFKLNNNFKGAYARVVMHNEPDLDGFITLRDLRSTE